ncbi:hypothetical protein Hanom_Chr01g00047871 [Helianthus anomalus]
MACTLSVVCLLSMYYSCNTYSYIIGKIISFVLYFYTIFQAVSFLTNVDRRCPLLGILLQV